MSVPLRIFISYRREDTRPTAGRIDDLIRSSQLGEHVEIFRDVRKIQPGENFVSAVSTALQECDVFLALIGSKWLDITDDSGKRRIDAEDDLVRVELASAIRRKIPIIPILVDGTRLPKAADLPHEIAPLSYYQGLDIHNDRFEDDAAKLIDDLKKRLPMRVNVSRWLLLGVVAFGVVMGVWKFASDLRAVNWSATLPRLMSLRDDLFRSTKSKSELSKDSPQPRAIIDILPGRWVVNGGRDVVGETVILQKTSKGLEGSSSWLGQTVISKTNYAGADIKVRTGFGDCYYYVVLFDEDTMIWDQVAGSSDKCPHKAPFIRQATQ